MSMGLAPLSPLWGQFNPILQRRAPKMAYFPTGNQADFIDTPTAVGRTSYLRSFFTIRFYIRPATWLPAADTLIFAFGASSSSNWSIYCAINLLGQVYAIFSKSGTTINGGDVSSTPLGLADNEGIYIAVSRNYSDGVGKIYKSTDGINWTNITESSGSVSGFLYNSTSTFKIGGGFSGFGGGFVGYMGKLQIMPTHSIPDSVSFCGNFDPSIYASVSPFSCPTTFDTALPQTWTVRGSASIVGPKV